MRTPVILKPPTERRQDSTSSITTGPAPSLIPGSVSIIQREPSGGSLQLPSSPLAPQPPLDAPPSPQAFKTHYERDERRRPSRRPDGLSSGPSNFTPLQPVARPTSRDRDPNIMGRSDHSVLLSQGTEMSYAIKLVDKSLHWEDRGMDNLMDQGDFLVVGVLGKEGVGKSTIMSLLAGTRTGATKPYMFRAQPKEIADNGGYQTTGVEMVVTGERIILLDTQPILSGAMLDQLTQTDQIPSNISPETFLDVLSLQMAIFLYSVCHVVLVVLDSTDGMEDVFKFLSTAEQLKTTCFRGGVLDGPLEAGEKPREYFPQIVFVLNHASPDDFQPFTLRDLHTLIAKSFLSSKLQVASGVSLFSSGIIPTGCGFLPIKSYKKADDVNPADINLHLLPSNSSLADSYGVHTTTRPEKQDCGLTPILALLPMYTGHPSFQLLSDTLRNQLFSMPRPPLRRTANPAQQQFTEREWFDYARRVWLTVKKSDVVTEYEHLLPSN